MAHRLRLALLAAAAFGMALSALPHAFGAWPHFRAALTTLGADGPLLGAVGSAWAFGTVMMLVCAAVVGGQAWTEHCGGRRSGTTLWPIGLGWLGYGALAFALRDFNTHYLAFVACGGAVLVALALPRPR